jgi:hypothetical protein
MMAVPHAHQTTGSLVVVAVASFKVFNNRFIC